MFRVGRRERERERERGGVLFNIKYVSSKEIKRIIMLSKVIVHEIA